MLKRYERVCFEKENCTLPGKVQAELLCPGHPLMEATTDLIRERYSDEMKRGTVFVDKNDYGQEPRLLFYIKAAI